MSAPAWETTALCRHRDPALFTPDLAAKHHVARAKAICTACPVRPQCLNAALAEERGLDHHFRATIRGGLTPRERTQLDRKNSQKEAA
ncbi:WhiB family transcriptional regulator [Streptomyces sp. NPDC051173]|uniref:WhiB family transcriptional regulator n=1 Tax=Streptomyces sp. NPDC051173 TaxID=3155164 RepID=UPI00344E93DA